MKLIGKKEFAAVVLDPNNETFVIHIAFLVGSDLGLEVHLSRIAQLASLKADEILIFVSSKYADFAEVFSKNLAVKLPEHININNYAINLVKGWQPPYGSIYTLKPMEL